MVRAEAVHTFPGAVPEVFEYMTDLANWHEYWPGYVRIENQAEARWRQPGDQVTVVLRLLNRDLAVHMELEEFRPDALVVYRTQQQGLPDAHHERHFTEVPGGVEYRAVVDYEPRRGIRGLYDRLVVKRAVERALRRTTDELDRRFESGPDS